MKKIYLLFLLFISFFANAQEPFITTWQIEGTSVNDRSINLGVWNDDGITDNFTIDFGDGTILTNQSISPIHVYDSPGTYTVSISGNFTRVMPGGTIYSHKLMTIEQWGDIVWTNLSGAFMGCTNMTVTATDSPDLSNVTDISSMFRECPAFNQSINDWDVSNVTNMSGLFQDSYSFDQPLDGWDVSNVTNMSFMFYNASAFDQPIGNWNVSNVENMKLMFNNATLFNRPLNDWNVSNVTDMQRMFSHTGTFNQDLNSWDVSGITDMEQLFWAAISFNGEISDWDVSNVTNMKEMFMGAESFNQSLNNWDVSNVTNMDYMFYGAFNFNQPLSNWDVSNVTQMEGMFADADMFNQDINDWDVSSVISMAGLFMGTDSFDQSINNWNTSNVTTMAGMFRYTMSFNQPLDQWDVSGVTDMNSMFWNAQAFNQPLNSWDVSNVTTMEEMFSNTTLFNQPLSNWDVSNVTNMYRIFYYAADFDQDISAWNFTPNVFTPTGNSGHFSGSGLSSENYDAILLKLTQLGFENKRIGANGLKYCNQGVHNYLINSLGWTTYGDSLATDCIGNSLSGIVQFDQNNSGCDEEDMVLNNFMINVNGNPSYTTYSSNGQYNLNTVEGSYEVSILNLPNYFTATPATSEITFEGFGNEETLNFCLTANETVNDLNITLLPLEEARPGFETDYQLVVQNMGTQSVPTATVTLSFDDTLQTFLLADPAPSATTANQLTFEITNLQPFESRIIDLTMELFTPPTVNGGEISIFTAAVTPNDDDYTLADNTFVLEQEVVNSYDPNDKTVLQGEYIYTDQTGDYLNYIIRFQNTGTASAITVRIEDVLHENLDWITFTPVNASHGYRVEITDGNLVEFIFDDINLPHEAADAEGSNGFIAYKIRPVADIQVGEVMEGNASIFFDYNLPIITNVATTEVIAHMEVSVAQANASCNGESDGSAEVNVSGGSGEYSYEWSSNGGTEPTAEGLSAGEYTVTITDSYGESITLQVTITQPGAVAVSSQPVDDETTIGGTATFSVTASNVDEYQWQFSPDGENWTSISDGGTAPSYSGTSTPVLNMSGTPLTYDGYSYRALLENGEDCETYSSAGVLEVSDVAGLDGINKLTIIMYPNPAKSEVFIMIPQTEGHDNVRLSVHDISGRQLIERPVSTELENVDIAGFAPGMYLFTISSDTARFTQQIIKE